MSEPGRPVDIVVNGSSHSVAPDCTVADLLGELQLPDTGIAVAVNRCVIPRSASEMHTLSDGDCVEIIQAVGGG